MAMFLENEVVIAHEKQYAKHVYRLMNGAMLTLGEYFISHRDTYISFMWFIVARYMRYGKLSVESSELQSLLEEDYEISYHTYRRAILSLSEKNLIISFSKKIRRKTQHFVGINLLHILKLGMENTRKNGTTVLSKYTEEDLKFAKEMMRKEGIPTEDSLTLDQVHKDIKEGKIKSKNRGKKVQSGGKTGGGSITPKDLHKMLVETAEENDIKYIDPVLVTDHEFETSITSNSGDPKVTRYKYKRMLETMIKESNQLRIPIKGFVTTMVKYWPYIYIYLNQFSKKEKFSLGANLRKSGRLKINFTEFYRIRFWVYDWVRYIKSQEWEENEIPTMTHKDIIEYLSENNMEVMGQYEIGRENDAR
jgi:hypothetical protein